MEDRFFLIIVLVAILIILVLLFAMLFSTFKKRKVKKEVNKKIEKDQLSSIKKHLLSDEYFGDFLISYFVSQFSNYPLEIFRDKEVKLFIKKKSIKLIKNCFDFLIFINEINKLHRDKRFVFEQIFMDAFKEVDEPILRLMLKEAKVGENKKAVLEIEGFIKKLES